MNNNTTLKTIAKMAGTIVIAKRQGFADLSDIEINATQSYDKLRSDIDIMYKNRTMVLITFLYETSFYTIAQDIDIAFVEKNSYDWVFDLIHYYKKAHIFLTNKHNAEIGDKQKMLNDINSILEDFNI